MSQYCKPKKRTTFRRNPPRRIKGLSAAAKRILARMKGART